MAPKPFFSSSALKKDKFTIHKGLLIAASESFTRIHDNTSAESSTVVLLEQRNRAAFKVVYQWLYLGGKVALHQVFPAANSQNNATDTCSNSPLFWLEVLILSDELEMPVLQRYAYEDFYNLFDTNFDSEESASQALVAKAFDPEQPYLVIQDDLVNHTAHQVPSQFRGARSLVDRTAGARTLNSLRESWVSWVTSRSDAELTDPPISRTGGELLTLPT
jgi:hypothetical protein